jgi:predicted TIM-barrel fold metal-dependent hydrolase
MESKFTNVHVHVFNSECAPENFLRIIRAWPVRMFPSLIKKILDKKGVRTFIWKLHGFLKFVRISNDKSWAALRKYIAFLNVGTKQTQYDIFSLALKVAQRQGGDARLVALTLDMDYMDNSGAKPEKQLTAQLEEVKNIKRRHPDHFFPFLGIDPRARSGSTLVDWSKNYLAEGIKSHSTGLYHPYFCGLKMYPALGFFPFDPRLDDLYHYAEKNGIPIMTHCTRSGSQYVGNNIEELIPSDGKPPMIDPEKASTNEAFIEAKTRIEKRILQYYNDGKVKNDIYGDNFEACDIFGYPQNYVPLMIKYPKLKICLAHMGGSDEIIKDTKEDVVNTENWANHCRHLMIEYDHLYTDISYTLSSLGEESVREKIIAWCKTPDKNGNPLSDRILFGTDYYMTEREMKEPQLYKLAKEHLSPWYEQMTTTNINRYLGL